MTNELKKALQMLQSSMMFKDGNVRVEERKAYVLKVTDSRGQEVDVDIPATNDKEVEIFIKGYLSASWMQDQIHTR